MNDNGDDVPFIALIDDDPYSAHLLTRMLVAHGGPAVQHYGSATEGLARLETVLAKPNAAWPGVVVVDLKSHSGANIDFLKSIQPLAYKKGVPVVVMTQTVDHAMREALYDAGAAALFLRQPELDAYRREAASIVRFWARYQRLDAVGM